MEQWFGYGSSDTDTVRGDVSDVDTKADAEIHFTGSTTTDNGLTFGVNVQLEAESGGDQIDEAYLFTRGGFGEILLGSENGAAYAMHYGFNSVGATLNSGDLQDWIVGTDFFLTGTYQGFRNRDNDSQKIRWISPRIAGFQIGADYSPEARQDSDSFPTETKNHRNAEEQVYSLGVNYDNTFGEVQLRLSGGFQGIGDGNLVSGETPYTYGFGALLNVGSFELGASGTHENDVATSTVPGTVGFDRTVIGGSLVHREGLKAYSVAAAYGWSEFNTGGDDEQFSVELGTRYIIGPGVSVAASLYYADRENDQTGEDTDGWAFVYGLVLQF